MASPAQFTDSSESVPSMQEPESQDDGSLNTSDQEKDDGVPHTQSIDVRYCVYMVSDHERTDIL